MSRTIGQPEQNQRRALLRAEHWPALILAAGVAIVLSVLGGVSVWIVLLSELLPAVGVMLAACGLGVLPAIWLGLGRRKLGQQLCIVAALGLGILSILTLGMGVAGWLNRVSAWCIVALGWLMALAYVQVRQSYLPQVPQDSPTRAGGALASGAALLALAMPIAVALFGACLPPGVLWGGENRAYDVLEYHLQVPREYFDAGRIQFLPHNVYASFPQQMEMLYLLLMHLFGGPLSEAIPAQLLHVMCGVLAVVALASWTPAGWPRLVVAIVAGSVPWLAYLGCLAYVELGMLLFAAVAVGLLLDDLARPYAADWRLAFAAGLCAGLAGGCKYTALVLVAVALPLAWLCALRHATIVARARRLAFFAVGVVVAFAPWLVRNAAFTGNPVYPFGYRWFGGAAWSEEQDQQWARGHRLASERDWADGVNRQHIPQWLGDRAKIAADELVGSSMFGPTLLVLAAAGLLLALSRAAAMLAIWFGLIVVGWAVFTHMPGRFAVPAVVPLALLAGQACSGRSVASGRGRRAAAVVLVCVAVAGAVANNATLLRRLRAEDRWWGRHEWPLQTLLGRVDVMEQVPLVNQVVPPDGRVWLVGDSKVFYVAPKAHYTVVFSRDPWLEYAAEATPEQAVDWLRTQDVTHVVFSWSEIKRLRDTYGFPGFVTRGWVAQRVPAGLCRVEPPQGAADTDVEVYAVLSGRR